MEEEFAKLFIQAFFGIILCATTLFVLKSANFFTDPKDKTRHHVHNLAKFLLGLALQLGGGAMFIPNLVAALMFWTDCPDTVCERTPLKIAMGVAMTLSPLLAVCAGCYLHWSMQQLREEWRYAAMHLFVLILVFRYNAVFSLVMQMIEFIRS